MERRESLKLVYVGSNPTSVDSFEKFDAEYTGVVKPPVDGLIIRRHRFKSCLRNQPLGPVVQLESEQSFPKRQVAGSSPAGFTMPA